MNIIKCSPNNNDYKCFIDDKELKKLLKLKSNFYIDDKTFINESLKLLGTMFNEFDNFDVNTEYSDVYLNFKNSIDKKYISFFTSILDFAARIIIHEIYLANNDITNITIEFDKISKASSLNRKHFNTAKEIAERVIKTYYFSQCNNKQIINYIDEYLPDNYTSNKDINSVVWYFIICIISFNKQVVNKI